MTCDKSTHLEPVLPTVPLKRRRDECGIHVHILEPSVLFVIGAEHNLVLPSHVNAHAVICERFDGVEVEDKEQPGPFKDDSLINLVFERDPRLR